MADLRHALRQDPTLAVGIIQDGAPELWTLLRAGIAAEPQVPVRAMRIDAWTAVLSRKYDGREYFFRSTRCQERFAGSPSAFVELRAHMPDAVRRR